MAKKALLGSTGSSKVPKTGRGSGLTPWPKGVSGNPAGGKPKALTVAKIWREIAEAVDEADDKKRKRIEVLGHKMYEAAKGGNVPAGKLFLDRAYGTALIEELPEDEIGFEEKAIYGFVRRDGKLFSAYVAYLREIKRNGANQG